VAAIIMHQCNTTGDNNNNNIITVTVTVIIIIIIIIIFLLCTDRRRRGVCDGGRGVDDEECSARDIAFNAFSVLNYILCSRRPCYIRLVYKVYLRTVYIFTVYLPNIPIRTYYLYLLTLRKLAPRRP